MKYYKLRADGEVNEISAERFRDVVAVVELSVALGRFDGVHLGHRALLEATKKGDLTRTIWTFLQPDAQIPYIMPVQQRLSICGKCGIEYAICEDFDEIKTFTPSQFVFHMVTDYNVKNFVCGYNFKFGVNRSGDANTLQKEANNLYTGVDLINEITIDTLDISPNPSTLSELSAAKTISVSSSNIRTSLKNGDMVTAKALLGRPYTIISEVAKGKKLGRTLGIPTINQYFADGQLIPRHGVYFTSVGYGKNIYPSITNIGSRPTVNGNEADVTCETNIFNFTGDIYGQKIELFFHKFHRNEAKFPDTGSLLSAIEQDIASAKNFFCI